MPPKSKRKLHLARAREAKRHKSAEISQQAESSGCSSQQPEEAVNSVQPSADQEILPSDGLAQEETSPSEELGSSVEERHQATDLEMMEQHNQEWITAMSRDDLMSLSMALHYMLVSVHNVKPSHAAESISSLIGKDERTIREWRYKFFKNQGEFPDSEQGKYQRHGVLYHNEELNEAASDYVRANAVVKGRPNMTAGSFCRWVNENLLPNSVLDPGYPRKISVQTARKWLHELGFVVLDKKKGVYIDGHERDDVTEHRRKFLRQLVAGGFLTKDLAPSPEAKDAFPNDIEEPSLDRRNKNIFIFHDESTFNANEDEGLQWGLPENQIIRPKSRGSGIMVSDFITETGGYLCLTQAEYDAAKVLDPNIRMGARQLLEYGEGRDGYWTGAKFMAQMEKVVKIAEAKYPKADGYRLFWVFDQSQCHMAYAEDALNVNNMNANPGGKQPLMHDTIYQGKPISMTMVVRSPTGERIRIPRGMKDVLKQRGCYHPKMKVEDMKKELSSHPDFANEKNKLETFIHSHGHACLFIPKFHCELNPIERCWSQAKRYTRAYCNYNIVGLRRNISPGLDSVSVENIRNYFRRARNYMYGYLLGHKAGIALEKLIQKYSKDFKSHRRVPESD